MCWGFNHEGLHAAMTRYIVVVPCVRVDERVDRTCIQIVRYTTIVCCADYLFEFLTALDYFLLEFIRQIKFSK